MSVLRIVRISILSLEVGSALVYFSIFEQETYELNSWQFTSFDDYVDDIWPTILPQMYNSSSGQRFKEAATSALLNVMEH